MPEPREALLRQRLACVVAACGLSALGSCLLPDAVLAPREQATATEEPTAAPALQPEAGASGTPGNAADEGVANTTAASNDETPDPPREPPAAGGSAPTSSVPAAPGDAGASFDAAPLSAGSCSDGIRNGDEPLIDCGNAQCGLCALDRACLSDEQCQSGFCQRGTCQDPGTCTDLIANGRESSTDCGGDRCPRCADLLPCVQASDCINSNCFNGICVSCGSGARDGTETDIDCGGSDPACRRCEPMDQCVINSDCISGLCSAGVCG